jgi:hypothetical protein
MSDEPGKRSKNACWRANWPSGEPYQILHPNDRAYQPEGQPAELSEFLPLFWLGDKPVPFGTARLI